MLRQVPVSCNRDCGGSCPLIAHVEDDRLVRVSDSPAGGPYMRGCLRGYELPRVVYAPERLRRPLLRAGPRGSGRFRAVSWDRALDVVAQRLAGVAERHGPAAVMRLGGSGSCRGALHNTTTLTRRFLALAGGFTDTYGGYSSAAVRYVLPYVLGTTEAGQDAATLADARLILLWGANVADCRFGPETYARIREARDRGVPVVVIDPRRTRTVSELGTEWLPVRPGTDSALMLAVLYVLLDEGLADREFIARYSCGFEDLERYVLGAADGVPKTPAWAEARCGTPAGQIVRLARLYGRTKPAALLPGLSIQRTLGGEEASRLGISLQVATGNLGRRGGSAGALGWDGLPVPRMGSMPVPANPAAASVPVYRWPDAVLDGTSGGYPSDVRAIYNAGGNYVVQGSDVAKNLRAFESVEFSVTHDLFLTPTAVWSDVVLPATSFLERNDIVFGAGNYVFFSNRAIPAVGEARNDYDIFCDLADRLGFGPQFSEGRAEEAWLRHFVAASEVPDAAEFRRKGIYLGANQRRTAFADFVADPTAHPLATPSGRVELAPVAYAATGFPAVPASRILPDDRAYPLRLITPKSRYRVHSQHANLAWFNEREPQALWIHPADAAARGIAAGDLVAVRSAQGCVRTPARLSEDLMPGVVCLLEGAWPKLGPEGVDTAGSPNVLTSTEPTLPSQASRTHSTLVEVARVAS